MPLREIASPLHSPENNRSRWPAKVVSDVYTDPELLRDLNTSFQATGYVKLPKFLMPEAFNAISSEVQRLYATRVRKDFVMPNYNTDRKMSVISGKEVVRSSDVIAELYSCRELRECISRLIGADIHTVHHDEEFLVVNFLDGERDTHGWHLDDPRYAFIVVVEGPPPDIGGTLEYVLGWNRLAREEQFDPIRQISRGLEAATRRGLLRSDTLDSSDCYLLDAGETLHRVSPMHKGGSRKALNLAFDDRRYRIYGETATKLYA